MDTQGQIPGIPGIPGIPRGTRRNVFFYLDTISRRKSFDVLLWTEELLYRGFTRLDAIQQLREYLSTIFPQPVSVNLWLPAGFAKAHTLLNAYAVPVSVVPLCQPDEDLRSSAPVVTSAVYLSHPAFAQQAENLVAIQFRARRQRHRHTRIIPLRQAAPSNGQTTCVRQHY